MEKVVRNYAEGGLVAQVPFDVANLSDKEKFEYFATASLGDGLVKELISFYPDFDFEQKEAMQAIANNGDTSAFFMGPAGTGKTFAAVGVYLFVCKKAWFRLKRNLVYLRLTPFFQILQHHLRLKGEHHRDQRSGLMPFDLLIKKVMDAPFVIIDDLGADKMTEWQFGILDMIVDSRYTTLKKRTIVTTNFTRNELESKGYDRIVSRINYMAKDQVYAFSKQYRNPDDIRAQNWEK